MRLGVAAAVIEGQVVPGDVEIDRDLGVVSAVGLTGDGTGLALPGFIDIHTHGYGGVDFARASEDGMSRASLALAATGVTGFQPTLLTDTPAGLKESLLVHVQSEYGGARFLGSHIEGPFLSSQYPGAHDVELLAQFDDGLLDELSSVGEVAQMTLAPELPGGIEAVRRLAESGVSVSLGHSDSSAQVAHQAFDAGARLLTHAFNASRPIRHRDPGILDVALTRPDVYVTVVADLVHLSREAMLLVMLVGPDRMVVVTDAMAGAGLGDGTYTLGGRRVEARRGVARLEDGTIASSLLTMDEALRNLTELGWPVAEAASAVSTTPARAIGRPDLGFIAEGATADIVVVDDSLQVVRTVVGGEEKFRA